MGSGAAATQIYQLDLILLEQRADLTSALIPSNLAGYTESMELRTCAPRPNHAKYIQSNLVQKA